MAPTPADPFVASLGGSIWGSSVDPGGKCSRSNGDAVEASPLSPRGFSSPAAGNSLGYQGRGHHRNARWRSTASIRKRSWPWPRVRAPTSARLPHTQGSPKVFWFARQSCIIWHL